ncbi:MAG TPA: hypothetical protein VK139_08190 [Microbacteriaceae bacterium]|nr:hypothetical protein [Microbacteriaceae bacterium]
MRSVRSLRLGSAVALSAGVALFGAAALPAAHATSYVGVYASYGNIAVDPDDSTVTAGEFNFGDTDLPGGTFVTEFSGDSIDPIDNAVETRDNSEEWLAADTPIGEVFGASGPSADTQFLRVGVTADVTGTTVFTFDEPIPADRFAIAIGDLDLDTVVVTATDADGNTVSRGGLYGSSTDNAFNLCAVATQPDVCSGETAVPVVTDTSGSITFAPDADGTDSGVTGWLAPNTDIASITITHTNAETPASTVRFWLAGLATATESSPSATPSAAELATTGSAMNANTLWGATALSVLGIAGMAFVAIRRARA